MIHVQISKGNWLPIRLSRTGPDLSHLFFTNDLVLFCKADMDQVRLLKGLLSQFCDLSGHKISVRKRNIYFSKGIESNTCLEISQLLGYQVVQNLGTYLRVPLLHEWVMKNTLSFVVDKVRRKLKN